MKTCLLLVLYFPDYQKLLSLVSSLQHAYGVVMIDNTPGDLNVDFDKAISGIEQINYLHTGTNLGIAEAQNRGLRMILETGAYTHVLFLDQDSDVDEQFIMQMQHEYMRAESKGYKLAALGPVIIEKENGSEYKREKSNPADDNLRIVSKLINSGLLIETQVLQDVGLMDADLFIDGVDFEWCWRAVSKGYQCIMTEQAMLPHKVGVGSRRFLGYGVLVSASFRYYYQFRNFILLSRRSYVPAGWKLRNLLRRMFLFFYIPLFTPNGFQSFKYILRGINDGLLNRNTITAETELPV